MIASTPIDEGQFEDPQEGLQDTRTPHAYIDTYDSKNDNDPLSWSDSSEDEYESEEIDDTFDENRVEDEDWENAEGGNYFQIYPQCPFPNKIYLTRFHKTIQSPSTACRRAHGQCSRNFKS